MAHKLNRFISMLTFSKQKYLTIGLLTVLFVFVSPYTMSALDDGSSIDEMKRSVETKKQKEDELKRKIREIKQRIAQKRSEAVSLANQLAILDDRIRQAEVEISLTKEQIDQINLEITQSKIEISRVEREIRSSKDDLSKLLYIHYQMEMKNGLEIILVSKSLSDYFNQLIAISRVEEKAQSMTDNLKAQKNKLLSKQKILSDKLVTLEKLKQKQEDDKDIIARQKSARAVVLGETRNSEERFKSLLEQVKKEQVKVNLEIKNIEKTIRKRIELMGRDGLNKLGSVSGMIDPVTPRRITTYFYDPHYPFRYLFEHPGLDLAVPQGSPVKAAASGFVAKVKDGGMKSYSYVMLVHANGISTVYMHVSKILVKENQFVNQGDIIALSGGTPGTPGAGRLSTGAHIQFEVRENGVPVDPLKYLKSN